MSRFHPRPTTLAAGTAAVFLFLLCAPVTAQATTVTLAWDANTEPDLAGYRIFARAEGESYDYDHPDWEGTETTCTLVLPEPYTNYYFVARAFDTAGNESGDSNEAVYEAPENQAPTADAGPDQSVGEGESVTLHGENSSDPDGSITAYAWTQTGGTAVALSDPDGPNPTFTAPLVDVGGEALTFQLTVTDDGGLTASDTVIVNVSNINVPPTADAGPDQSVGEGTTVTLDGTNSSDPDGNIVSYQWVQTAGTSVTLSGAQTAQPTFTAPNVDQGGASLTFQLTVTDNGGLQSTDTCIVNVSWVNMPPTADAGPDQSVNEGALVTLDGSASSDPDDGIASYLWTQTGGASVTMSNPNSPTPTFTAPEVNGGSASLTFQLTVTDNGGLTASDTVIVNVSDVNQPPTADAGPDQTVDAAVEVTLDGSGSSDPDGTITSYTWTQTGGTSVVLSDPNSPAPTFTAPDVGPSGATLTFQLTVTDDGGLQSTDTCTVNVVWVDTPPAPPRGVSVTDVEP